MKASQIEVNILLLTLIKDATSFSLLTPHPSIYPPQINSHVHTISYRSFHPSIFLVHLICLKTPNKTTVFKWC